MSVLWEGPPYYAMMMLVIMSWSCWTDSNATEANSTVCLQTCTDLDIGGAFLGDVIPRRRVSPWLDSTVFCTCVSTLFTKESICRSFSLIVLVSLVMTRAIFANCSSMYIVLVAITDMATENEEVKELDWSKELFWFDTLIGEPLVELASSIGCRDLSPKSFIVEWCFSLLSELYAFAPKEAKVMTSW